MNKKLKTAVVKLLNFMLEAELRKFETMKKSTTFLIAMIVLFAAACTPLQARRITNVATQVDRSIGVVCSTVELFEAFGVSTIDPDVCAAAVAVTGSEYYAVAYRVAQCATDNDPKSIKFGECVDKVDGWKLAAEKIVERF